MKPEPLSPLVLVILPAGDFLALSQTEFAEARALGDHIATPVQAQADRPRDEPLLTAEQMEARTSIPATWFLEQARKDAVPHVRLGKYVRFRFGDEAAAGLRGHAREARAGRHQGCVTRCTWQVRFL